MSTRSNARGRITALERFVLAWDNFIALQQHLNAMNPRDENYDHVKRAGRAAQDEVTRARARIGGVAQ